MACGPHAPLCSIRSITMATVEVILTEPIPGLGAESDKVKVRAGYARNYLLPMGKAILLTEAGERRLARLRERRARREAEELQSSQELANTLAKIPLKITVRTGEEGRLFGAVTAATIARELKHQWDVDLDRRKIHLEAPIKELGEHEVQLRLHPQVHATLKVLIESSTPLPGPETSGEGGEA